MGLELYNDPKNSDHCRWAVKGQGGTGHFNEQNNDYIKRIFAQLGWYNDLEAENQLREQATVSWFKNTVMVFRPPT